MKKRRLTKRIISYELIGFIIVEYNEKAGQIVTIDIHPSYRRMGFGEGLLKLSEIRLRNENVDTLYLCVAENNQAAINLYAKLNFQFHGVIPDYYRNNLNAIFLQNLNFVQYQL